MKTCIVCGKNNSKELYRGLVECLDCGHVFANADLTDEELNEFYKKDYFFGNQYEDYIADKKAIQKNFQLRLDILEKYAKKTGNSKLLEIGCAYGYFLELAKSYFGNVTGIDITEDGVRHCKEVLQQDAIQSDFLKYDFGDRKFDIVCMWDTIEHLREPQKYVEKASTHLHPGGLLALTTGDIRSFNARFKKEKWRLISPPAHLHYFSCETIKKMLDGYGFDVIYNRYCGFYRSMDNIAYIIFVLNQKRPGFYKLLKNTGITKFDLYLNLYDIMYIIAKKR